jgi:uncharacterized damage-inducible protein DinB
MLHLFSLKRLDHWHILKNKEKKIDMDSRSILYPTIKRNTGVILQQTDTLKNEDSFLQPPVRGNCMNWILGHILCFRERMLFILGNTQLALPETTRTLYTRDSEPITRYDPQLPTLEQLLSELKRAQALLKESLQAATPELLTQEVNGDTVLSLLHQMVWHETYHVGQLELLRQLAGTNDKVI